MVLPINLTKSKKVAVSPPDNVLEIYVGTTWFSIEVDRSTGLTPNGLSVRGFVRSRLTQYQFDPRVQVWVPVNNFSKFNKEDGRAYFPRYFLDSFLESLPYNTKYNLTQVQPYPARSTKIHMKKTFVPRDMQSACAEFVQKHPFAPIAVIQGGGKGLRHGTPVKVPGGWKNIEDLKVGDKVTAVDGTATKVTGVYPQGKEQIYRVTFDDGRYVDTDEVHRWTILNRHKQYKLTSEVVDTRWLINYFSNLGNETSLIYIPLATSENVEDIDLPIPPYVLGALIGDGCIRNYSSYKRVSLYSDADVLERCVEELNCPEEDLKHLKPRRLGGATYYCPTAFRGGTRSSLAQKLTDLGLMNKRSWEKFIPEIYMNSSTSQRLALLQGLMDTDGHVNDPSTNPGRNGTFTCKSGSIEFSTTSQELANQMVLLVRSLGGKCSHTRRITHFTYNGEYKAGRPSYRIRIRMKHPDEIFSLLRKRERCAHETQYSRFWKLRITGVTPLPVKDDCTCISVDHPSKLFVVKDYIVTHNTVAATYSASILQGPALIVLGMLIPQWYKSLKQFTTLKNDDICIVQGFDSLAAIWKMVDKKFMPKVVLFSTRTLILYIEREPPYNTIPSFAEFQRVLGFKVKVMDEVHMNFFANTRIDLFSNIEYNIYLSATYQRTDSIGRKIFDTIYPPAMRFGEQFDTKYTTVTMVQYNLSISPKHLNKFKRINGYMHALYEKFLLKYKSFYNDFLERVLLPLIHQFFITCRKDGQRLLILCQTRDFASKVYQDIRIVFTELKVNKYFAGGKGKETDLKNLESDIIVSTIKSCGTGRDIKDLKTCINTVSFSSEPLASQVMGRLRELKGEDTFFVDMWNGDIPTHKHHKRSRLEVYKKKALKVYDTII